MEFVCLTKNSSKKDISLFSKQFYMNDYCYNENDKILEYTEML